MTDTQKLSEFVSTIYSHCSRDARDKLLGFIQGHKKVTQYYSAQTKQLSDLQLSGLNFSSDSWLDVLYEFSQKTYEP